MTIILYLQSVPEGHHPVASDMEPTLRQNSLRFCPHHSRPGTGRAVRKAKGLPEPDRTMTTQQLTPSPPTSRHLAGNPASWPKRTCCLLTV